MFKTDKIEVLARTGRSTKPLPTARVLVAGGVVTRTSSVSSGVTRPLIYNAASLGAAEQETIENRAEYIKADVRFENTVAKLAAGHPTNVALNKLCSNVCTALGQDPSLFKVEAYQAKVPNAFINTGTRTIRITSGALEVFAYRDDLIEAVLAHEIGHYIAQRGSGEKVGATDSVASYMGSRVDRYEEEYQVDRYACLAMTLMNKDPMLIHKALNLLQDWRDKIIETDQSGDQYTVDKPGRRIDCKETGWGLQSHPFMSRRNFNIERTCRSLPANTNYSQQKIPVPKESEYEKRYQSELIAAVYPELHSSYKPYDHKLLATIPKRDDIRALNEWWHNLESGLSDEKKRANIKTAINALSLDACQRLLLARNPYVLLEEYDLMDHLTYFSSNGASLLADRYLALVNAANQSDEQKLRSTLEFLRNYSMRWGVELCFTNPILGRLANSVFSSAKTDAQRADIVSLLNEYGNEINAGLIGVGLESLPKKLPKEETFEDVIKIEKIASSNTALNDFIKQVEPIKEWCAEHNKSFRLSLSVGMKRDDLSYFVRKVTNQVLPSEITGRIGAVSLKVKIGEMMLGNAEITSDNPLVLTINPSATFNDVRGALLDQYERLAPKGSAPDPVKVSERSAAVYAICQQLIKEREELIIAGDVKTVTQNYLRTEVKELLKDASVLESHVNSLSALSEEERDRVREAKFEVAAAIYDDDELKKQYLLNRASADNHTYSSLDRRSNLAQNIIVLWQKAFADEFKQLVKGKSKLDFLAETFPIACMTRDNLACEALGYPSLVHNKDIAKVRKAISHENDIEVLVKLRDSFANPLFRVLCAKRLHEYGLQAGVLPELLMTANAEAAETEDPQLKMVLAAYNFKSYTRDELLKPFIDKAPTQKQREQLASLLLDSPIVQNRKRSTRSVIGLESLRDGLNNCSTKDKREALLYLLGQREFDSSVTELFDLVYVDVARFPEAFSKSTHDHFDQLTAGEKLDDPEQPHPIKVKVPDIMMKLSQVTGTPLDVLFEQGQAVSSEREQLEFIQQLLFGHNGAISSKGSKRFMNDVAALIVDNSTHSFVRQNKKAVSSLLALVFEACPKNKLARVFLDIWKLSREEGGNFPHLAAKLMQSYGPVMVKFGQFLSGMNIPQEWRDEFRKLCSKNTVSDSTLVDTYLRYSFGGKHPFVDIGAQINEGSMAACYRATKEVDRLALATGHAEERAIKVFHPFIARELHEDTLFVQELVDFLNTNRKQYGDITIPQNLPEVIEARMQEQIDPQIEVANAKALQEILAKSKSPLKVNFITPYVFADESKSLVVSSKYQAGVELDDHEGLKAMGLGGQSARLRHAVGLEVLRQILEDGVFQADPNLGNFGVIAPTKQSAEPTVIWYDPGNIGRLEAADRKLLRNTIILVRKAGDGSMDTSGLAKNLAALIDGELSVKKYTNGIEQKLKQWLDVQIPVWTKSGNIDPEKVLNEVQGFFAENNVFMKEQWVNLTTTLGLLRPLLYDCANLQEYLKPIITKLVMKDMFGLGG